MEEIYKKILNGKININYLSPIDLIKLKIYLEQKNVNYNDLLIKLKDINSKLEDQKNELQSDLTKYIMEEEN